MYWHKWFVRCWERSQWSRRYWRNNGVSGIRCKLHPRVTLLISSKSVSSAHNAGLLAKWGYNIFLIVAGVIPNWHAANIQQSSHFHFIEKSFGNPSFFEKQDSPRWVSAYWFSVWTVCLRTFGVRNWKGNDKAWKSVNKG